MSKAKTAKERREQIERRTWSWQDRVKAMGSDLNDFSEEQIIEAMQRCQANVKRWTDAWCEESQAYCDELKANTENNPPQTVFFEEDTDEDE